ncbi:choline BCCT transporter BetT [Brevibacterium sp. 50QC2O2]|uniref:choline BCCT transporter BetT n=1 Tax=Brevibacterium TaxID=1696 RepID=UPI00211C23F9|nr:MULTISPECIES: choline BCCT transporter BetT [unclassified Brevibacterium]MCQ9385275.1 choline BCCT transporter BetT [Brevibacterium sp. 68QC2CO]MCQ9388781.1 choline BCCT transporter BetT [Brevibacterium sp. 50QC2O2]
MSSTTAGPLEAEPHTPKVNWPVFGTSAAIIVAIAVWAIAAPGSAHTVLTTIVDWVSRTFGWYYIATATIVIGFVLFIAASSSGRIKLGPDHAKPQFNMFTWTSMLFAAGIGIDLMFFSVSEPAAQFLDPPQGHVDDPLNPATAPGDRARMAIVWTLFHYGITGWAMYALMGAAFAYFAYRRGMPLSMRSILSWVLGRHAGGGLGNGIEVLSVLGTIFGIATSLGIGVVQLNWGLHLMFGIDQSILWQAVLIALSVLLATISTVSGVNKGIRRLSELNVILAVVLMVYVIATGQAGFLFDALVTDVGDYVAKFPELMLNVFPFTDNSAWMSQWTLFFWAWWIAWAPFVGLFLARISRGRTIRQFVFGVLVVPFVFIAVFISVFGNSALRLIMDGDLDLANTAANAPEQAFYALLEHYPGAPFVIGLATVVGLLFYVTSADSGALVLANFSSHLHDPKSDGGKRLRVFWSVLTGVLTLAMLIVDGVSTLQGATLIIGLPFSIVLYLVMIALYRALRQEASHAAGRLVSMPGQLSGTSGMSWRARLRRLTNYPGAQATARFIDTTATSALEKVAGELRDSGATAQVERAEVAPGGLHQVQLVREFPDGEPFSYQLYPVACEVPRFALRSGRAQAEEYYRVEVFTAEGSRGYDVLGFTEEQLIADVLANYESHVEFLRLADDQPDDEPDREIITDWEEDF